MRTTGKERWSVFHAIYLGALLVIGGCSAPGLDNPYPDDTGSTPATDDSDTGTGEEDICPEDFNDDGVVNEIDQAALNYYWGTCPEEPDECPWDLDGNGAVEVVDMNIMLAAWGDCPES